MTFNSLPLTTNKLTKMKLIKLIRRIAEALERIAIAQEHLGHDASPNWTPESWKK